MLPVRNKFRIDYDESDFSRSSGFIPGAPYAKKPIEKQELSCHHLDRVKMNNAHMLTKELILTAINAIELHREFLPAVGVTPDVLQNCPSYPMQSAIYRPQNIFRLYFGEGYEDIIDDIKKALYKMNRYLSFSGNRITFFNSGVNIIFNDDPHDTSELSEPNICRIDVNLEGPSLTLTKNGLAVLVLGAICEKVLLTQNLACVPSVLDQWERTDRCHEFARCNPGLAIRDTGCWISFIGSFSNISFA
ncbi:MAG: hypothetical protein KAH18_10575 [Psychromonas sp.]|nr:hypothetical protein [Psychromonas sp.]